LSLLAEFVRGDLDMPAQQRYLWPLYAFDVIPLEFISSIYETFVTERASRDGIFYTPPYLVDFILDRVLPWDGKDWDLKIIDPACG
jgi:type I restriction-modification system DNA methylase subunit